MKKREFDNILDKCLERILTRGETIEQCLTSYPEQAAELEPLLQTVLSTKETLALKPRPEFRDRARHQMLMALRGMEEKRQPRSVLFGWQPRWATAVIAVLILVLASGSTVAAASGSMPDEPLYPVKLATERVRLALTPSALGKAELYAKLADKRVTEIIKMSDKGKLKHVERATQRLNSQLTAMATLVSPEEAEVFTIAASPEAIPEVSPPPEAEEAGEERPAVMLAPAPPAAQEPSEEETEEQPVMAQPAPRALAPEKGEAAVKGVKMDRRAKLRMIVIRNVAKHREELRAALERAPESAKPALRRALAASNAEYEKVLDVLREEYEQKDED